MRQGPPADRNNTGIVMCGRPDFAPGRGEAGRSSTRRCGRGALSRRANSEEEVVRFVIAGVLRRYAPPPVLLSLAVLNGLAVGAPSMAQPVEEEIIITAPGGAAATEAQRFPGNVQAATDEDLRASGALNLSDFMRQNLGSVHINDAQSNPYQPELFYRGFGSSSLLGFPQGISVYLDGVRRNELFGDVINWDTVPDAAMSRLELIPGSNPLFGLNTLGGAISMQSKSGFTHPGIRAEAYGGSFGRFALQAETGSDRDGRAWYLTAEGFTEDGWRDFSGSELGQAFGKYSFQGENVDTDLALTLTDSELRGNGAAPEALLAVAGREAIFTHPDITENRLAQFNLRSAWAAGARTTVTGIAYYRDTDTDTFNGDGSDYEECESPENAGLVCEEEDDGEQPVFDQFGNPIAATEDVEGATENSSETSQYALGGSLQAFSDVMLGDRTHRILYGGSLDYGDASFGQRTELARLSEDRGTVGSGFIDRASVTDVDTGIFHGGLFVSDSFALSDQFDLTLSARYNYTDIKLRDQLDDTDDGVDDDDGDAAADDDADGSSLTGDHSFDRLNPAIAFSWYPRDRFTVFGSYAESSRAPTPAELTCANPDDPCRLPNAFVDDPPLEQVVTRTVELGVRGDTAGGLRWSAALFNAVNEDDILFISDGSSTSRGFFDNVGDTRRRGLEFSLTGSAGPVRYGAHYTYINAEFRDAFLVNSPNHPLRDPDNPDQPAPEALVVTPGNRIPGVPEHLLRLNAAWDINDRFTLGADMVAQSDQFFRGDESNTADPLDGFAIFNLNATYRFNPRAELFARVNNLFDTEYETFGVFGEPEEVLGPAFAGARRFVGPGAPFGAWIGLRMNF
jgi:outer membrane receptor protein involved in Fe transport